MNDFEKIFSEKLHHHKTPPPANGWDQLNAALDKAQNARKRIIYWRVAAAVLLLLIAGVAWWGTQKDLQEVPVAVEFPAPVDEPNMPEEQVDEESGQLALEDEPSSTEPSEKQVNKPGASAKALAERRSEVKKMDQQQIKPVQEAQATLASAQVETVDTVETQPIQNIQSVETLAVEPLSPTESELLALESVKARVSPSVTIIYKPGNHTANQVEESDEKNMALELLNDIKNTNISFLDIRNAKAELLAKVFSKKENEVTP